MRLDINNPFYRICKKCGREFETSHGNRQFCPPEIQLPNQRDCKMTYNNLLAKIARDKTKSFNRIALRNMTTLETYFNAGIFVVRGAMLTDDLFDSDFCTGLIIDPKTGAKIPLYYGYKLIMLSDDKFKIEKYDTIRK